MSRLANDSLEVASLSAEEVIAELEALLVPEQPAALAFDGDGTLWAGDVSEDVFLHTVSAGLIRADAADSLRDTARDFEIATEGSPSELAARLFEAYRQGRYPERQVCEMMTWCYAGFTAAELSAHAAAILTSLDIDGRRKLHLAPILTWARARGLRTIVISASPRIIVEVAAAPWQFATTDIAGGEPLFEGERIAPRMNGEIPYEAAKCRAGRRLLQDTTWLASFGDNIYDVDMMRVAKLAVAIDPKPALQKVLPGLGVAVLRH